MNKTLLSLTAAMALSLSSAAASADGWSLSAEDSKIAFGSVKKDTVGEAHHFTDLEGSVTEAGVAKIDIDVTSVETWIDIRNERMVKHIFDAVNFPKATITTTIDMDEVSSLKPGESATLTTKATLKLLETEVPIEAELFVIAVSADKVMVTTDEMLMVSTEDLGINQGVDELMELAKLPSITRVTPVTLRLMFVKG